MECENVFCHCYYRFIKFQLSTLTSDVLRAVTTHKSSQANTLPWLITKPSNWSCKQTHTHNKKNSRTNTTKHSPPFNFSYTFTHSIPISVHNQYSFPLHSHTPPDTPFPQLLGHTRSVRGRHPCSHTSCYTKDQRNFEHI